MGELRDTASIQLYYSTAAVCLLPMPREPAPLSAPRLHVSATVARLCLHQRATWANPTIVALGPPEQNGAERSWHFQLYLAPTSCESGFSGPPRGVVPVWQKKIQLQTAKLLDSCVKQGFNRRHMRQPFYLPKFS